MAPAMAAWEIGVRDTWLSQLMLAQGWLWPVCEVLHYIGLTLLLASVGIYDLRVLGFARGIAPAALHRLVPWGVTGLVLNVLTGLAFFAGFPEQYAYNPAFRVKLAFMAAAACNIAVFYLGPFRALQRLPAGTDAPRLARIVAGISLGCWLVVIVSGRLLTFYRPPFIH